MGDKTSKTGLVGNEATRFKPGVSGNPGGMPRGYVKPSAILRRYSELSFKELVALDDDSLTIFELKAKRQLLDMAGLDDEAVRLAYMKAVDERVEGKAHQAAEVKIDTTVNPIERGASPREQAMAAADLMRSQGIDVPAALQALIEAGDDDE